MTPQGTQRLYDLEQVKQARRILRRVFVGFDIVLMFLLPWGCPDASGGQAHQHADHYLGAVDFPVTCSKEAQAEFNRAVALLHHMTYPQAREAFERVAAIDPRCAMAHWGVTMTLFQPLWPTRPRPEALRRGWEEAQKAKALQPPTERERLFVAAAEAFFLEPESADYWLRIRRWEQAEEKVYAAFPDDPEAAAFYALAHLATTPSNTISRTHADRAAEILLRVYKQNPDHPGAMHYLVHANDVPGRERELLEVTRKYEAVAPDNPHAIHMPTHIYTRLGDWDAVIVSTHVRTIEGAGRFAVAPAVAQWIDTLATRARLTVVANGNPYVIRQFPRVQSYVVTYGVGEALERAAAHAIAGSAPITGHSPISLPGFFVRGDGLARSAINAPAASR